MPITKYKLISVTADAFHGTLWSDMRLYMSPVRIQDQERVDTFPREGIWPNGAEFKRDSVYILTPAPAA